MSKNVQELINTAFKMSDELDDLKATIGSLQEDRDVALKTLKDAAGVGPFVHPGTSVKYRIVQRQDTYYFRTVDDEEKKT